MVLVLLPSPFLVANGAVLVLLLAAFVVAAAAALRATAMLQL